MPPPLPSHILLFDGLCHLCDASVQWVLAHDRAGLVHFCSIQSPTGSRLYAEAGHDPAAPHTMILITPEGRWSQSDAVLRLLEITGIHPFGRKLLALIPRPLRDLAYRCIAANRYRWFGKRSACTLPQPGWEKRFLS